MNLIRLWQILWQRKWTALLSFSLVAGACVGITLLLPPVYQSEVTVLVRSPATESYLKNSFNLSMVSDQTTATTDNFLQFATSEAVLSPLIERLQLKNRKGKLLTVDQLLSYRMFVSAVRPRPNLTAKVVDNDADLLEITAEATDPETAMHIAGTLVDILMATTLARKQKELGGARELLRGKADLLQGKYLEALQAIRDYKSANNILNVDAETSEAIDTLSGLLNQEQNLVLSIAGSRARIKTLKDQLAKQSVDRVSSDTVSNSHVIQALQDTIRELELTLTEELIEKTPNHPDIVILNLKLERLKADLGRELASYQESASTLQALERELASFEDQQVNLKLLSAGILERYAAIPEKTYGFQLLATDYSLYSELYNEVLRYGWQLDILAATLVPDIVRVAGPTVPDPDDPDKPRQVLNAVIGIILGLMAGLCAAFLREQADETVRTEADLPPEGPMILGRIRGTSWRQHPLPRGHARPSPEADAYLRIRRRIDHNVPGAKRLVITSAVSGEGRAMIAANLGMAMAASGQSVLLVDLDLRRPKLHRLFRIAGAPGLTDLLKKELEPGTVIRDTGIQGLWLLPAGALPDNPVRLLESSGLAALVTVLSGQYDRILMTAPPILPVEDALILASLADGCIDVFRFGSRSRAVMELGRETWNSANRQPIGLVLTRCPTAGRQTERYG